MLQRRRRRRCRDGRRYRDVAQVGRLGGVDDGVGDDVVVGVDVDGDWLVLRLRLIGVDVD